jgi:hypothetical protein
MIQKGIITIHMNAISPIGFNKTAFATSPCNTCKIDLVIPHEGQATPTVFFKTQICRPGFAC